MRIALSLEHGDEVSGTWIMDDGTKCFWSEGRSSGIVCVLPNRDVLDIPVWAMDASKAEHPAHTELIDLLIESTEEGPDPIESRAMTPAEEAEHEAARK
jgi:hypothetical protein